MVVHLPRGAIEKITSGLECTLENKKASIITVEQLIFTIEAMVHGFLNRGGSFITTRVSEKYSPHESLKEISEKANSHR